MLARPHRKSSVPIAKQRTSARWARGDLRDRGGRMQNLATHSLGTETGQECSRVPAYDVGRGRITGAIACFSVGAVLFARAV